LGACPSILLAVEREERQLERERVSENKRERGEGERLEKRGFGVA